MIEERGRSRRRRKGRSKMSKVDQNRVTVRKTMERKGIVLVGSLARVIGGSSLDKNILKRAKTILLSK